MSSTTNKESSNALSLKRETDWLWVIWNLQIYISFFCGLHLIAYDAYLVTTLFSALLVLVGSLGVTAGSHRLWAHQSYTASTSLKIFLMLCQTLIGNGTIYSWVRYHRLHHRHFGTDLDPYNPKKGFIYSHFFANVLKLSPAQEKALEEIDMSDIEADKIVMFQKKYYWFLFIIVTLLLPINAPAEYWGESILNSVFIAGWIRYGILYHISALIHSATKIWDITGDEKSSQDSNLVFFINKSYWLSYHYLTPWDYQTGEFGKYGCDCTSKFIRVCAALEMATDLKTTDSQTVREALAMSVAENKSIAECLTKVHNEGNNIPVDHYLIPAKFL